MGKRKWTPDELKFLAHMMELDVDYWRACQATTERPLAGNYAADFGGKVDIREGTWGRHDWVDMPWIFNDVPKDKRVRILSISGDVIMWPTTRGIKDPKVDEETNEMSYPAAIVPNGTYMGGLGAVFLPRDDVHGSGSWMVDDHFVYVQTGTNGPVARAPFSNDLSKAKAVLGEDNKIKLRLAMWLNDTGLAAHMELTISSLIYQYVPA